MKKSRRSKSALARRSYPRSEQKGGILTNPPIAKSRIDAGFSVAKSWSTGVSHECSGGPGDTVCLWARTPYVEYEVHNIEYDTCSVFGTDTERYRIKSPNKNEDVRPYCVVGIEYCRNKGDNYWQFDGLEEYPYWYHKGR
ncbi:hypothetical protein BFW01_g8718 [Lasiodiplodia theobromae]|nr:hypothetical protein BFW01_g8718 [Lasiodiplodia theobromae]